MSGSSPAKHIRMLRRRVEWLSKRTQTVTYNATWDKAEIAALEWAIEQLEARVIAHRVKEHAHGVQ